MAKYWLLSYPRENIEISVSRKLIEDGFTFITGEYDDGGKIFRKPK